MRFLTLTFVCLIGACATQPSTPPIIDGSSEEAVQVSLNKIYRMGSTKSDCRLFNAVLKIQQKSIEEQKEFTGADKVVATPLGPKIDGMSYADVIQYAHNLKTEKTIYGMCI